MSWSTRACWWSVVAAVASLGLQATIAHAVKCEVQRIELNSCVLGGGASDPAGGSLPAGARPIGEPRPEGERRHQQAVHRHTADAIARVPAALAKLQRDAAFFGTAKGSLVALALARKGCVFTSQKLRGGAGGYAA